MKKIFTLIIVLLSAYSLQARDRSTYTGAVKADPVNYSVDNNNMNIDGTVSFAGVEMKSQYMLELTPVLKSRTSSDMVEFDPIVIAGGKRYRKLKRELAFGDYKFPNTPQVLMKHNRRKGQGVNIDLTTPFEKWMRQSDIIFQEKGSGCNGCRLVANQNPLIIPINLPAPALFEPKYNIVFLTPPVEEIKQRSESHSAFVNYEVAKHVLLPNYKNNANILAEVDKIISEVKNDDNLTITQFKVAGYASPEGNANSNQILSENRATAFINYLRDRYGFNTSQISVSGMGEDWAGLRKAVAASSVEDRDAVLDLIDNVSDVNQRKARLKSLSGGRTYRNLLDNYYPPLRRNDYTITYVARPFNIEEARVVFKKSPHHLSLNEMYVLANAYSRTSEEFKEIFDVAVRLYPHDQIAVINASAKDIENGAYDVAIARLQNVNMPAAWNNIGMAYIYKKDTAKAMEFFKKAADAGDSVAADNLRQLNRWIEERK